MNERVYRVMESFISSYTMAFLRGCHICTKEKKSQRCVLCDCHSNWNRTDGAELGRR